MPARKVSGNQYTPKGAVTALRKRAEALAPGRFEADLRHLGWLAHQLHLAVGGEEGVVRDLTREFGIQLRATSGVVGQLEEAQAARLGGVEDWKLELDGGASVG